MSVNGPQSRYQPLRGTARLLLLSLRRGQEFTGPVERLADLVGATPRRVWLALAVLADRQLVRAAAAGSGHVRVAVTRTGRAIRL